jgi:hypothetical protein
MVPAFPTATQKVVVGQLTPFKLLLIPLVCAIHVAPPLAVARIVPLAPTASQKVVLGQLTLARLLLVPLV